MTSMMFHQRWLRLFVPLVWLAVVQVLVITVLASSSEMHERFHQSSNDADHHCLVTDFKSGAVGHPVVVPVVCPSFTLVSFGIVAVATNGWNSLPTHLCGSLLEHGPPARLG